MSTDPTSADPVFTAARPRLFAIAYRMLGTRADAEDVLQDAWLRWHRTDPGTLQSAEAWLVTVVTRLAIDRLRAAKAEREAYVGWWLPEPLVEQADHRTPEAAMELAGELSLALLWAMERLAPEERAAFLLRQVFEHDYDEIAALLDRSEAACRQMVHRATERVQQARPRFEVRPDAHRRLVENFMRAVSSGERQAIKSLLADGVTVMGDGGGKVPTFGKVLLGADRITNLYWAQSLRLGDQVSYRLALINGEPGLLRYVEGRLESAQAFVTDGERIHAIYTVRNPDKLAAIPTTLAVTSAEGRPS
ncbi:RNA polymerase sigma-70 factor [Ideonella sp. YS5]|uniref:RNA polymerase sigma-70 factor n=1 Tax=Ideonella sp. YS5 TaxID=3453714 RepID=UPI003EECE774